MKILANRCAFWTLLSLVINVIAVAIILAFLFDPNLIYLMLELKSRIPAIVIPATPTPTPVLQQE